MKRKSIIALTISSLCLGVLSAGGALTYAAFSTKKKLNRFTTVKHMVRFQATGDSKWWGKTGGAKTAIYIFNSTSGKAGQFANDGAFMEKVEEDDNGCIYIAPLPPNKEGKTTIYDKIIFVRCKNTATIASWDEKWNQTVDLPYDDTKGTFILYDSGHGDDCPEPETIKEGEEVKEIRRSGTWSNSVTTYSYSAV